MFATTTNTAQTKHGTTPPGDWTQIFNMEVTCPGYVKGIKFYRAITWRYNDLSLVPRKRGNYNESYTRDCTKIKRVAERWRTWAKTSKIQYKEFLRTFNGTLVTADARADFHLALATASRVYNVSYSWLHNCNHSEGSDRMVWNHSGSGAFGPMQFLQGTFYSNAPRAFAHARSLGFPIHSKFMRWNSYVGQAFTAAFMFKTEGSGQWTGAGC